MGKQGKSKGKGSGKIRVKANEGGQKRANERVGQGSEITEGLKTETRKEEKKKKGVELNFMVVINNCLVKKKQRQAKSKIKSKILHAKFP